MTSQRRPILLAVLAVVGLLGAPAPAAWAAASPWLDHEHARVRLVAAGDTVGGAESVRLGLQFKLKPGWKIYWRSPGDAGFPPQLQWDRSENLAGAALSWPVPERFSIFGLDTFGYRDEVVLPIVGRLERPGEAVALNASLTYLVCEEICVPHDGEISLALPAGPAAPARHGFLIEQAMSKVPGDGSAVGLSLEAASLVEEAPQPVLRVVARSLYPLEAPDLLIEGPPGFSFGAPRVRLSDGGRRADLTVTAARGPAAEGVLEGKRLTLTLFDGQRGLESEVVARHGQLPPAAIGAEGATLLAILGLALLGGLILNLMPCVLPVLSIKLLSVVSHGGGDRRAVRISFLATAAGILASFLVLALGILALKGAGMAVGWGIQFQQPVFLVAMAAVVMLFALNLLDLFEISLPQWLGRLAMAGPEAGGSGLSGPFLTGAFATLLATPCSAPFLGTAVGFALARGPVEVLLIFAVLGLGLALPYLLVAALPGLATRLPRPGRWMIVLRRLLGLALAATMVWLLSILGAQLGAAAAVVLGAVLLGLGLAVVLRARFARPVFVASAAGLLLAALTLPALFEPRTGDGGAAVEHWQPLDRDEIRRLVADGKVVFVDVTADWCLTCRVNKTLVLDRGAVAERLSGAAVVPMRGDWTLPSQEITDYLADFGRYGIPFNAVYGPGTPAGRALPELLTEDAVLEALDSAAGAGESGRTAQGLY